MILPEVLLLRVCKLPTVGVSLKTIFAVAAPTPFVSKASITSAVVPVILIAFDTVTVPVVPPPIEDNVLAVIEVPAESLIVKAPV